MARRVFGGGALVFLASMFCGPALAQAHEHGPPTHQGAANAPAASKPWSQADAIFGEEEMAAARAHALHEMGAMTQTFIMADRLEAQAHEGKTRLLLDAQGWHGGDIDKLWFKAEAEFEADAGEFEEAEFQVLWSRAVAAYWDFQAGLRYDLEPRGLSHAVIGIHGLAPFLFEVDAAAFLSQKGDLTARLETEYELFLSRKLILQPRLGLDAAASDIPERNLGAGLSGVTAGLRLRYAIAPEFAPYIGLEWERRLGKTARAAEASGEERETLSAAIGVRLWF